LSSATACRPGSTMDRSSRPAADAGSADTFRGRGPITIRSPPCGRNRGRNLAQRRRHVSSTRRNKAGTAPPSALPFLIEEGNAVSLRQSQVAGADMSTSTRPVTRDHRPWSAPQSSVCCVANPRTAPGGQASLCSTTWNNRYGGCPGTGDRILSPIWCIFLICSSHPTPKVGIRCSTPTGRTAVSAMEGVLTSSTGRKDNFDQGWEVGVSSEAMDRNTRWACVQQSGDLTSTVVRVGIVTQVSTDR
jgi:hypothetical protein